MDTLLSASRRLKADLAVDLGTANTIVVQRGQGVVFSEPTVCCFREDDHRQTLIAAGAEANRMVGRVTGELRIARPLLGGVLSDLNAGRALLRHATRASRPRWGGPKRRALIGVPADATQAERSALKTAAYDAGLGELHLMPEPLLAAIGAGLDITKPRGRMLVDCGAGTTEVAVISLGDICLSKSIRIGGETLNASLIAHLHLRYRFRVGQAAAEDLKLALVSQRQGDWVKVAGQNLLSGLPGTIEVPRDELQDVYEGHLHSIVTTIKAALHETPPELSHDILEDGLMLTGGGSMMALLAEMITHATGLVAYTTAEPLNAVAMGLERLLNEEV